VAALAKPDMLQADCATEVRGSQRRCALRSGTEALDQLEPALDLVPTGRHRAHH